MRRTMLIQERTDDAPESDYQDEPLDADEISGKEEGFIEGEEEAQYQEEEDEEHDDRAESEVLSQIGREDRDS